ncbi:uncharacterized protein DNG_00594 [Cephalotrichum gorgonifer]|uniref:Uncharacterized protein n=1 Tax=Cephalotrichum gorgonifer TaxID=2041049 RepID=A0AAE8MR38_9PEZI|nr:uncharacterized protein DNG_00594 [Cephalotrichum gorgonifer]
MPATTPPGPRLELGLIEDPPLTDFEDGPFPDLEDSPPTMPDIVPPQHASLGGKDDISNSMHSSPRFYEDGPGKSLPSEAPRDGPPQLLYKNLHPDRGDNYEGDCDFFPRLEMPSVSAWGLPEPSSQANVMLPPTAVSELTVDITDSTGVPPTPATLAAMGGQSDSYIMAWIAAMQYNKLGGAPDGANSWAVGEDAVAPATRAAALAGVGEWSSTMEIREYHPEVDVALNEGGEEGSGWVLVPSTSSEAGSAPSLYTRPHHNPLVSGAQRVRHLLTSQR